MNKTMGFIFIAMQRVLQGQMAEGQIGIVDFVYDI